MKKRKGDRINQAIRQSVKNQDLLTEIARRQRDMQSLSARRKK